MELPEELISEIFLNLQEDVLLSERLHDLRVAFTCKALYRMFHPHIVSIQAGKLLWATLGTKLRIEHSGTRRPMRFVDEDIQIALGGSGWEPSSRIRGTSGVDNKQEGLPVHTGGFTSPIDIRLTVRCCSVGKRDVEAIWCLNSLISREDVVAQLRRVRVVFRLDSQLGALPSQPGWETGVSRLLEKIGGMDQVELEVTGMGASKKKGLGRNNGGEMLPGTRDVQHGSQTLHSGTMGATSVAGKAGHLRSDKQSHRQPEPTPQPLSSQSSTKAAIQGHLTSLRLNGHVFRPILRSFVDQLIYQSSSSLTNLQLHGCDLAWTDTLPQWMFPKLSHFTIEMADSDISLHAIVSFLCSNLSILEVKITTSGVVNILQAPGITSLARTLPNLQRLHGTPEILLPLIRSFMSFLNLEDVIIDESNIIGLGNLGEITEILSHLPLLGGQALRKLSLNLPLVEQIEEWMSSASSSGDSALPHSLPVLSSILSGFRDVKYLDLRAHTPPQTSINYLWSVSGVGSDVIFKFVGAFPGVEEVVIDVSLFDSSCRDRLWQNLAGIWERCVHLRNFWVRGKGGDEALEGGPWTRGQEAPTIWSWAI
ncbi:hypothetical protein D9611_011150 [Ephemerocybe angulata]|uniref:F-box domain-containing protein n=1 Tax=Ephemerocybe angulata TaxID=980116 RepID=A0A8H5CCB6_9AGAR|nr:hypothetical protein D9611_011150 [Tulosesus angulatus]